MSSSPGCPPTLKTPAAHEGEGKRGAGAGGGAGALREAPPVLRRAPGQPTKSWPMERRGLSLCPDLGPPPTRALGSAAAGPPRLLPPLLQKLFMRSAGWRVARWDSAPGRGSCCGLHDSNSRSLGVLRGAGGLLDAGVLLPLAVPLSRGQGRQRRGSRAWPCLQSRPSPLCMARRPGGDNSESPSSRAAGLRDALSSAERPEFARDPAGISQEGTGEAFNL
nr:PREDICTED: uncharacterized protein LOC109456359 [Rhinolophus sinicus]